MADFQTTLVTDSVINDISPDLEYAVKSGASSTTYQSFPASSPSNSSVTFSIQVPSENVIVSRDVLVSHYYYPIFIISYCNLLVGM